MEESFSKYWIFGRSIGQLPNITLLYYDPSLQKIFEKELLDMTINNTFNIFFFYPEDFSFVCPTELKKLNECYKRFLWANTEVYVISRDSIVSHKKRVETDPALTWFQIKMLSDRDGDLLEPLNLFHKKESFSRITLITSNIWTIYYSAVYPHNVWRSINELCRTIENMNYLYDHPDQLCSENRDPNSWKATITKDTIQKNWNILQ